MNPQPFSIKSMEDDPAIATFLQTLLEREGFVANVLDNGRLALQHIKKHPPDLILPDLMLPGIDGLELCRAIRRTPTYMPIIMMTAKDADEDKIVGLELGADNYITKPIKGRELSRNLVCWHFWTPIQARFLVAVHPQTLSYLGWGNILLADDGQF